MYKYPINYPAGTNDERADVMPPTYMWLGIVATLVFISPIGIASIVFASKVRPQWHLGDREGARKSSFYALLIALVSIGIPVVGLLLFAGLLLADSLGLL